MKESNTLASNATRNLQVREILLVTKRQHMKESNTLAHNATRNLQIREVFQNTIWQYMKESNTLKIFLKHS